jgi:hypothetical protein
VFQQGAILGTAAAHGFLRAIGATGLLAVGLCVGVAPSEARAQSIDRVEVVVSAEIPTRCGFAETARASDLSGDLDRSHVASVRLSLDCNAPYAITARSVNGRLEHVDQADDGSGYAFNKPYGLSLSLETDRGRVQGERCASSDLIAGGAGCALSSATGLTSGDGVSIGRDAVVTIDWSDQSDRSQRLAAGQYSDTIILEIGARA